MAEKKEEPKAGEMELTEEQEALLILYEQSLDNFLSHLQNAEKREMEIETMHLKSILTKW